MLININTMLRINVLLYTENLVACQIIETILVVINMKIVIGHFLGQKLSAWNNRQKKSKQIQQEATYEQNSRFFGNIHRAMY